MISEMLNLRMVMRCEEFKVLARKVYSVRGCDK